MHFFPTLFVFHRIQGRSDARTLGWQRWRKVIHCNMLKPCLITQDLIPIISEVWRPQFDIRWVRQKKNDSGYRSSVNRNDNICFRCQDHLIHHGQFVNECLIIFKIILNLNLKMGLLSSTRPLPPSHSHSVAVCLYSLYLWANTKYSNDLNFV